MTLIVAAITSSGIVLTADSRQTYRNLAGNTRIGLDSAMKVFKLTPKCGVAVSGRAFLSEAGQAPKDVGYFVKRFAENNNLENVRLEEVATRLSAYLGGIFVDQEKAVIRQHIADQVAKDGGTNLVFTDTTTHLIPYAFTAQDGTQVTRTGWVDTITMIVAGMDDDGVGRACLVTVPQAPIPDLLKNTQTCGAVWGGQTDVLTRIVKGMAPELTALPFVQAADPAQVANQLGQLEYNINWGTITLQDAVDFCVLVTRTTESIQRFSDGTAGSPGGITGVGGHIDIAVITPERGFTWLRKKGLKAEGRQAFLDGGD